MTRPSLTGCWGAGNPGDQRALELLRCEALRNASSGMPASLVLPPHDACEACCGGGSLIGNTVAYNLVARAVAAAGNLDFVDACPICKSTTHALQLLSRATPAPSAARAPDFTAAAEIACRAYDKYELAHRLPEWLPEAPRLRRELRLGLQAWARGAGFPPLGAPLDDVAVHLRCGDVLKRQHPHYGMLRLDALAALLPRGAASVGIVTLPFSRTCSACARWMGVSGGRPHACPHGRQFDRLCSCACAEVVAMMVRGLKRVRPDVRITVHDADGAKRKVDGELRSWARLALAPAATVCLPSTFCFWPTMAAVNGHFVASPIFPDAGSLRIPGFHVVSQPPFASYDELRGLRRNGKRKAHPGWTGNCTVSPARMRSWMETLGY